MRMLFKKIAVLIFLPIFINATSLKELLQNALKNNQDIKATDYNIGSKEQILKSVSNLYSPVLNAGANYSKLDIDLSPNAVGATTVGYIKFGATLYDGGKNKATKRAKSAELKSAKLSKITTINSIFLQEITLFYHIKTIEESIKAYKEKAKSLYAQYKREKERYDIKMVTLDEVLKLKSEYESNSYTIEELKYEKETLYQNLSLLSDKKISSVDNSKIKNIDRLDYKTSSNIKALKEEMRVYDENIKSINAIKKPKIKLEESINFYNYGDYNNNILKDLPNTQNRVALSFSITLFDSSTSAKKESAMLLKMAKKENLNYTSKRERMAFELALKKLSTQKRKIESAKSALNMAKSTYKIVKVKYQNGVVDNVAYLDALSKLTLYEAEYYKALNDYEIAKANYYFSSGVSYKEFLKLI